MKRWILGLLVIALCAAPATANSIGFFGSSYSPNDTNAGKRLALTSNSARSAQTSSASRSTGAATDANPNVFSIKAVPIDFGST